MIQARGGGVSNADIAAIVDRLEQASGTDPLVRSARFNFGASTAVLEVRSRERPTEVDRYTFRGHTLVDTTPVRIDVDDDLEATSRPLSTFALDEVERIADEALAEFDASGGYVTGLSLIVPQQTIRVDVESPRATGTGVFDAEGDFQEFQR
ncbi:MAG TPA: hypothetical protein VMM60_09165 [Ilumatobacter sp.]|nr:hypothetical protein [Ilumatobacter sp.]